MSEDTIKYTTDSSQCQPKSRPRAIDPREARIAMIRRGLSATKLAKSYNVTRQMIYYVISNQRRTAWIVKRLGDDLGEGIFLDD